MLPSAFNMALGGNLRTLFSLTWGCYEALRLDITSSDLLLFPALSDTPAPLTTWLHVTLWSFPIFPVTASPSALLSSPEGSLRHSHLHNIL